MKIGKVGAMKIIKYILLFALSACLFGQSANRYTGNRIQVVDDTNYILSASPYAYYDASLMTNVNGDTITSFTDQSGNSRHLVQATKTIAGIYESNSINGQASISFSQASSYMRVSFGETINQPNTIVAVFLNNSTAGYVFDGYSSILRHALFNNTSQYAIYSGSTILTGVAKDASFHSILVEYNSSNSNVFVDSVQTNTDVNAGTQNLSGITIMARGDALDNFSNGKIALLAIFDRKLTVFEIADIHRYINRRFNLW